MLSQDEVVTLLATLYQSDALQTERTPELQEIYDRHVKQKRRELVSRFINPLAIRVKLFDPESLLNHLKPLTKYLFTRVTGFIWLLCAVLGIATLGIHWDEFTKGFSDKIFSYHSVIIFLVLYPLIKGLHELGHALAIKKWGGEVHNVGIMFLVLMPVPYVDASASWSFRNKYHRMLVGSAGILVEVFIACMSLIVWANLEPGLARSMAYNAVIIGGVSTILFNANPLLRFDGYYVLMDWLEMPNLATRANAYTGHLAKHYLLQAPWGTKDWGAPDEQRILFIYAVLSYLYRIFLSLTIAIFVASQYLVVGVALAIWALFMSIVLPVIKLLRKLLISSEMRKYRQKSVSTIFLIMSGVFIVLTVVPVPYLTVAHGIVWMSEDDFLRSSVAGTITDIKLFSGNKVSQGEVIIKLSDSELESQYKVLRARRAVLEGQSRAKRSSDYLEAIIIKEELQAVDQEIAEIQNKIDNLTILAPFDGVLILHEQNDLLGRFVKKGQSLGFVLDERNVVIRVAVEQLYADLVRSDTEDITVRFATNTNTEHQASIIRQIPGATRHLPSEALTVRGGGLIANDAGEEGPSNSYEEVFLFDLASDIAMEWPGERVYVRFNHGYAPLAAQWHRVLSHLFNKIADF